MSGGSFNYICFAAEEGEIINRTEDIKAVEEYLRYINMHEAADEVLLYLKDVETIRRRLIALGKRISPVLYDAEWTASGDYGIDKFKQKWEKFVLGESDAS